MDIFSKTKYHQIKQKHEPTKIPNSIINISIILPTKDYHKTFTGKVSFKICGKNDIVEDVVILTYLENPIAVKPYLKIQII